MARSQANRTRSALNVGTMTTPGFDAKPQLRRSTHGSTLQRADKLSAHFRHRHGGDCQNDAHDRFCRRACDAPHFCSASLRCASQSRSVLADVPACFTEQQSRVGTQSTSWSQNPVRLFAWSTLTRTANGAGGVPSSKGKKDTCSVTFWMIWASSFEGGRPPEARSARHHGRRSGRSGRSPVAPKVTWLFDVLSGGLFDVLSGWFFDVLSGGLFDVVWMGVWCCSGGFFSFVFQVGFLFLQVGDFLFFSGKVFLCFSGRFFCFCKSIFCFCSSRWFFVFSGEVFFVFRVVFLKVRSFFWQVLFGKVYYCFSAAFVSSRSCFCFVV